MNSNLLSVSHTAIKKLVTRKLTFLVLCLMFQVAAHAQQFITRWDLSKAGSGSTQLSFGVGTSGTCSYTWETIPAAASGSGTFSGSTLTITGLPANAMIRLKIDTLNFRKIVINSGSDKMRLVDVEQWGATHWTSMETAFVHCANLEISATDVPDLTQVSNMRNMFYGCTILNGPANINTWNTSNVTNMNSMFLGAQSFNQPIGSWSTANVTSMDNMFFGAQAFNQPIGNWNTANVAGMSYMFYNATNFNQPIGTWNTANVTRMDYMFSFTSAFNQPIGGWNTAKVSDMTYMFLNAQAFNQSLGSWSLKQDVFLFGMLDDCGMDVCNYSATLSGWSNNANIPSGLFLDAGNRFYAASAQAARNYLTSTKGWTIMGDGLSTAGCPTQFITKWDLSKSGTGATQLSIPVTTAGTCSYSWETIPAGTSGSGTFSASPLIITGLPANATIRLKIDTTNFRQIFLFTTLDKNRLIDIEQWGRVHWTNMMRAFGECKNMNISATDVPDLSGVTNMQQMFWRCTSLNGPANINSWNTSNITSMVQVFWQASAFNQPIGNWNTSNVLSMMDMFYAATAFNQPIGNWNTANVKSMSGMFRLAEAFNQPIGNWNISNVKDLSYMFNDATSFNQSLGNWNTSNVTNMTGMFAGAKVFNQNIANWNTSNVTNMSAMFGSALAYNQPVANWNISNVGTMSSMFAGTKAFNQPLANWNTANVKYMAQMFSGATAFNQSLGNWQLNPVVNMTNMLDNCGMDCCNYSGTLNGWANNASAPSARSLGAAGKLYSSNIQTARNYLASTKGWVITGDAANGDCCPAQFAKAFPGSEDTDNDVVLYPCPVQNNLQLQWGHELQDAYVKVLDIAGKQIAEYKNVSGYDYTIDMSSYSSGHYFIQVIEGNTRYVRKVFKD